MDDLPAWVAWNANIGFVAARLDEVEAERWGSAHETVFGHSGQPLAPQGVESRGARKLISGVNGGA